MLVEDAVPEALTDDVALEVAVMHCVGSMDVLQVDVALEVAVMERVAVEVAETEAVLEVVTEAETEAVGVNAAVRLPVALFVGVTVLEGVISAMHHVTAVTARALSNPLMPRTPMVKRCRPDTGRM